MTSYEAMNKIAAMALQQWLADNNRQSGQLHIVDARDHHDLQAIVANYGPGWESSSGLSWKVMRVDQLVNVYIQLR